MREIKFRAWDKENEIMICPKGILFDGRVVNFSCGMLEAFEGYEIMQYTGLKDKNGKEIYEGDIVRCYGGAYWNGIYEYDHVIEVRDIRDLNGIEYSENVEILGNKYENPELLKEESE